MWIVVVQTYRGQSIMQREQWMTEELALRRANELRAHWMKVYIAKLEDIDTHRINKLAQIIEDAPKRNGDKRK
jgi:hypothetical protein